MDGVKRDEANRKRKRRKARNNVAHLWTPTDGGWSNTYSAETKTGKVSNEQQKYKQKIKRMAKRMTSKCIEKLPDSSSMSPIFANISLFIWVNIECQPQIEENKDDDSRICGETAENENISNQAKPESISEESKGEETEVQNNNEEDTKYDEEETQSVCSITQSFVCHSCCHFILTLKQINCERNIIEEGNEYIKCLMKLNPSLLNKINSGDIEFEETDKENEDKLNDDDDGDGDDEKAECAQITEFEASNDDEDVMNRKENKNEEEAKEPSTSSVKMRPSETMIASWCEMIPNEQIKNGQFTQRSGKKFLNIFRCHHRLLVYCCITKYCEVDPIIRPDGSRYYECNEEERKLVKFYVDRSVLNLGVLHGDDKRNKRHKRRRRR